MTSTDLLQAGWTDVTGSFAERDRYLEMAARGEAVVRRLHDGWFAKQISAPTRSASCAVAGVKAERGTAEIPHNEKQKDQTE